MTLSEILKELRREKEYSQKKTAQILGVSTTCYAGWEQGYREPGLNDLKKIALLFDVTTDCLLGLENNELELSTGFGCKVVEYTQLQSQISDLVVKLEPEKQSELLKYIKALKKSGTSEPIEHKEKK